MKQPEAPINFKKSHTIKEEEESYTSDSDVQIIKPGKLKEI